MTEAEWLAADDPNLMLDRVGDQFRKLVLLSITGCRLVWDSLDEKSRQQVEVAEQNEDAFWNGADVGILYLEVLEKHPPSTRSLASNLVREIFGNPFRPVAVDLAWRTSTVLALAQQMYDSRDFSPMPILADALQDAGCENEDILAHCRGEGPHVRGCWIIDMLLGKE